MQSIHAVRLCALVLTVMLFAACGGGGDNTPAGPAPGISVSNNGAVTVPAGGTATSTITIARTGGYQGTVALSLSGHPASVTGTVAPSSVPSGATSATITWTAVASAAAGAYTATVQATGSGVTAASTSIPLSVSTQPPAAIVVLAGDNQSIASGEVVPVLPRVVVRDAQGRPVAGVSVTFTRDSGGSQLTDSIRVTEADGIAQLGAWRPGPGRNVIRAVAGALTPVFFRAEGTGSMTIGDQIIPSAGGTITVNRPGDPLHGMQITVPAQAYAEPLRTVVQYGEPAPVPGRVGTVAITPAITLSGDRPGNANSPLQLRVPARVPRTGFPVAMIRDLTTGAYRTVPAVVLDSQRVFVLLESLDGSLIEPRAASSLRTIAKSPRANAALATDAKKDLQAYALQMIIGVVPYDELTKPLDTGYRPAVDNWAFDQLISRENSWTRYSNGLPLAAAWYFDHFKAARGALRGRFQKTPGVELSDVQGIRLMSEIDLFKYRDVIDRYNASLLLLADAAGIPRDSVTLLLLKVALHQTGRPQLLSGGASGDVVRAGLLVYRANGNVLDVTLGTSTNGNASASTITYANGLLGPTTMTVRDFDSDEQQTFTVQKYDMIGQAGLGASELNALWQQVFDGSVGGGKYPSWHLASKDEPRIPDDTIWIAEDSVRFWVECACQNGWEPENGITPTDKIATARIFKKNGDTFSDFAKVIQGKGVKVDEDDDGKQVGLAIGERIPLYNSSFIDWTVAVVKVRRLTVTPAASTKPADTPFTLTADISRAVPSGATYEWELGDGRKITTGTKTAQVEYPPPASGQPTTYTVKARIKKDGKTWASGKTTVTIEAAAAPFWRMTSFVDVDDLVDPPGEDPGQAGVLFDVLWGAETVPRSALIAISGNQLSMRTKRSGIWTDCCPPGFGGDDYVWVWPTLTQSTTDLGTGTMTGLITEGASSFRFQATRNGKIMTGTMTLVVNQGVDSQGRPDISTYRFTFTAERLR